MSDISKRIKELREKKRISQYELADRLHITQKAVSSWETGRCEPSIDTLRELSEVFGVDITELIVGSSFDRTFVLSETEKAIINAWRKSDELSRMKAYAALVNKEE